MKLRLLCLGWLVVLGVLVAGCEPAPSKTGAMGLFFKANTAYKSGEYEVALTTYESIVESGYMSVAVYYNIGNCYMKLNLIGRAIVWYERAARLNPRDADLQANLKFARTLLKNPEVPAKKNLEKKIFIHIDEIADDEIVIILCFILSLISILILVGLYKQWRFRKAMVIILILNAFFVFYFLSFLIKIKSFNDYGVVLSSCDVKYEPEEKATTHYAVFEGWKVRILKESTDWTKIERPDGLQGWLPRLNLEKI